MCPHFMKLKSNGDSQRLYRVAQFMSLTQDRETYEVVQLALHDTLVTQWCDNMVNNNNYDEDFASFANSWGGSLP